MKTSDFSFELPDSLIANNPAEPRDSCRLLVLDRDLGQISHTNFFDIGSYLNKGDVLVFNDSKVIPARIYFKYGDKQMEILLIRQISDDIWKIIGKPGKLLKPGSQFEIDDKLTISILDKDEQGEITAKFAGKEDSVNNILRKIGKAPFPPYIKDSSASFEDYQTVYARNEGSIASPTAGLHFTNKLLDDLRMAGVEQEFVTLHVGLGTFLPVKTEDIKDHRMHHEIYNLDVDTALRLNKAKNDGRRIIAVGTTAVRVLESSYDKSRGFEAGYGETNIFIYPGYKWKCVDAMVTNFLLPKSTLLMLVSAFAGTDLIMKAYQEAISYKYRFYSFGDAMLIL